MGELHSVWALVALSQFEWTGTSTGGVYAVLAAALALGLVASFSRASLMIWIVLSVLFAILVGLTKIPSLFTLALALWCAVLLKISKTISTILKRNLVRAVLIGITIPTLFGSLVIFSNLLDRISFSRVNPGLGQLSEFGRPFVTFILILSRPWLWIVIAIMVVGGRNLGVQVARHAWLATYSAVALVAGLLLELTITGQTNTYSYFSGPMYFVAGLALVSVSTAQIQHAAAATKCHILRIAMFFISGCIWGSMTFAKLIWEPSISHIANRLTPQLELLRFFASRNVVGASVLLAILVSISRSVTKSISITRSFVVASVVLTLVGLWPISIVDFTQTKDPESISLQIGNDQSRIIGDWLRNHSRPSDLVATNHLSGDRTVSEIALAVWSQREFLVLGPQIGYETDSRREAAIALSKAFVDKPTSDTCVRMRALNVKWFVVDKGQTTNSQIPLCAIKEYEYRNFSVLSLRD